MKVSYKLEQLTKVAEHVIDCESGEYDSYVTYCDENELDPKHILGQEQQFHVYALALAGLGMTFEECD
jgi:hypothetical protein